MKLVAVALTRPPGTHGKSADELLEAILGVSVPSDGLEHVRLHPSRTGAVGVLYLSARDSVEAASAVPRSRLLCERACRSAPPLHGWRLDWCSELPPVLHTPPAG